MISLRRLAPLPLLLAGLAVLCLIVALAAQAQTQEVTATATAAATGTDPPAKPTDLEASAVHDSVTLTWTASTDQTVTHYAILRRNPDTDALGVFHVIESNAGPETSYTDSSVSASSTYVYRVKSVDPTGVSQWSGYVRVDTPAAPDPTLAPTTTSAPSLAPTTTSTQTLAPSTTSTPTLTPSTTSTPTPEPVFAPAPEDLRPTGLTVSLVENKVTLSWAAPAEDAESVDGYEILRRRPNVGESTLATLVADTESTATAYTDATANEAGVRYVYRVKALRGDEVSLWSNYDRVDLPADYVLDPPPAPEPEATPVDLAPSNLTAEAVDGGGGVTLSWSAPAEDADSVTGYEVLRAVGEGEPATLVADTGSTDTAYTDATATDAGETYAYQVKAIRDGVRSQASGEASVAPPAAVVVAACEFDAGGSDLPADTTTACVLEVGGSVRGETGAAGDVDWYRVALQAGVTYQFDMRGKSTGGWQLVDGAPAFVSVGTLEDPKLLGVYDASGALVAGSDSEAAGTGKDSRIASFGPGAGGVYYISASVEGAWTGTYELSLAVTAGDNAEDLTGLAPGGLEVTMVRNRLTLSWTAPTADADSVTGYEILRAASEAELATLVADTQSTDTTHRDDTATTAGVSYTYAVKALRGDNVSVESNRASYQLPDDYLASTKEAASKVFESFTVIGEAPEPNPDYSRSTLDPNTANLDVNTGNPQFVVQTDQDQPTNIWNGTLILELGSQYWNSAGTGSLTPNTFIFNGTTYTIEYIWAELTTNYFVYPYEYDNDLHIDFNPDLDAETYETWTFVAPGGREFYLAHASVGRGDFGFQRFTWSETGWDPPIREALQVSLTGLGGTGQPDPEPDPGPPGIKLSWTTKRVEGFSEFKSKPVKAGFEIYRHERNLWGNFASGEPRIAEVVNCDNTESDQAMWCVNVPSVEGLVESWTWTDEAAERGVSYLYTIVPYHDFYSSDGTTIWAGITEDVISGEVPEPAHLVRVHGRRGNVMHRRGHPSEPGTPTNLRASQPNSGDCTGSCVRLTWDPPANATKYVVFRTGQRTRETWVDNGLTYPQQRFGDPDLTVTDWEDTSAEAGVNYGYRVAAFNEDGLRSAGDAVVGFETSGGITVPNRVRGLSAEAALKDRVTNTAQTVGGDASLNTSTRERFAQRFKTGGTSGEVGLRWIAVTFGEIQDVSTAPDVLEATVNAVSGSVPGTTVVCTLTDPVAYVSEAVNTYYASGCDLDANTAYFFVLKRTGGTKTIELAYTTSLSEDPGSSDWRIADSRYRYDSSGSGTWSSANQVHLIEVIHTPMAAEVTLNWTAPVGISSVPNAKYLIQYRLNIPERAEWEEDWKTVDGNVSATATTYSHPIALEKYYPRGGTTPPFEYVPTAFKDKLRLNDADAENDLILPFGIYVEYRIRGVSGSNKGLATEARSTSHKVGQEEGVRIPNQDGLPPVVLLTGRTNCVEWDQLPDAEGNDPDGYRVLIASRTRRFWQQHAVTHYIGFESRDGVIQEPSGCSTGGEGIQGFLPTYLEADPGWTLSDSDRTWWIVVQAYDGDGIAKGDSTGGGRKQGWEILKDINDHSGDIDALPRPRDTESETVPEDGS